MSGETVNFIGGLYGESPSVLYRACSSGSPYYPAGTKLKSRRGICRMTNRSDVLVVGAGFAGMYALYRYRNLGLDVTVLEAGSDVGGTWYWNRYPGARCDVPSLEYSYGFSEALEQEWDWPEVFSAQPDILRYANHVADRFDLRRNIRFNTRVAALEYTEADNLWRATTEQGDSIEAQFCVMATGCLSVPNKPKLPGADSFRGRVLHTGLWPKEAVDLSGSRVGIIGTGSSGVQAIPELARQAEHLTVFQRTPVYTVPANRKRMRADVQQEFRDNYRAIREMQQNNAGGISNFRPVRSVKRPATTESTAPQPATAIPTTSLPTSSLSAAALTPNKILNLTPGERLNLVTERGLNMLLTFRDVYTDPEANEAANETFREAIGNMIDDPEVGERLSPKTYGLGCKRQVLDRDYYETFNRDDVTLVDISETPIETITAGGIRTGETHYDLDVLIYATGFDAMTGALLKANIQGRDGLRLVDKWRDGPVAYLGLQMFGFPNLFTVTGPGSPSVLSNMLVAIEQHVNWIGDCIKYLGDHNIQHIEPTSEAETDWVAHVNDVARGTMYTTPSCSSWYLGSNVPGKPRIFMPYVGGYPRYRERCEQVVANGYEGFRLG
ncbi:MAG: NAD(P)/FAD-dependent oxidoreductase [Gammaproteobacteria bacterium]|nr:NAD(P)/FAD-dependent oxidoreductase [Gammaproteobacteria bacterium]